MNIEALSDRFIPEDLEKQVGMNINSVMTFLQDAGYKDIMVSVGVEHPDKRIEGEEIVFIFSSKMTVHRFDALIDRIIQHRINRYGEKS